VVTPGVLETKHNEHVLREILGMSDDEIVEIVSAGVLT
jgi:hypothetical protein